MLLDMELKKQAISSREIDSCCFFIKSSSIRSSRPVVTLDKPATLPLLENILTELKNWLEENLWMLKLLAMKRSIQSKWKIKETENIWYLILLNLKVHSRRDEMCTLHCVPARVTDESNGKYLVEFTPTKVGPLDLDIGISGVLLVDFNYVHLLG